MKIPFSSHTGLRPSGQPGGWLAPGLRADQRPTASFPPALNLGSLHEFCIDVEDLFVKKNDVYGLAFLFSVFH